MAAFPVSALRGQRCCLLGFLPPRMKDAGATTRFPKTFQKDLNV